MRTEEYLSAEGTSLGADDGIGVAEAIYIMKTAKDHGPLRLIVTTDEEQSMKGAIRLSAEHLKDASFLINCDSENYDELTVGSAGSVDLDFTRELKRVEPETSAAWRLEVKGLLGGHSGERIGDGRGNAIRTLAMILTALQAKGEVELASLRAARRATPSRTMRRPSLSRISRKKRLRRSSKTSRSASRRCTAMSSRRSSCR